MNNLESFILEQEWLVSKAPLRDADGERDVSLGAKWDTEPCACSKKQLQNVVQNQGKNHFSNT